MRDGRRSVCALVVRRAATALLVGVMGPYFAAAQTLDRGLDAASGRSSADAVGLHGAAPIPATLIVPDVLRSLVESTWQKSPTFRRQCARLAERPDVVVRVALAVGVPQAWARSRLQETRSTLVVTVQIELRKPSLYVEYLAHELEHVLEYVDGTDVARLARQGLDGVFSVQGGFETARARAVGRTVAREVTTP